MTNIFYGIYMIVVGIISIFTGEIVTFIMLGIILMSLNNINSTLKMIYKKLNQTEQKDEG
ncbi:hypothetical protein [Chengkuizengella sediminis]|uniref:hypothetical protein n=1 Tax=Chengkuizengella sediminis TaxID=1885917 RepID=UPI00138A09B5|nr:hypothetical protein [Chengkuizengella sediminis]NDI34423.1 hypothetical protein [Chengkuizengella sediminis]